MSTLLQQAVAPRLQVVSGRGDSESWDEVPALRLSSMFRDFRSIFSEELKTRFKLDGTPDEHVLLSLKMSPFIDTSTDGAFGKRATQELMNAIYKTKLRARHLHMLSRTAAPAGPSAASPATPTVMPAVPTPATLGPKKRQKVGSLASVLHSSTKARADNTPSDVILEEEIRMYEKICCSVDTNKYSMEDSRYDLNAFWSDHKIVLPIHYLVYLGDCGSKRASSASVETVYSGATKLADEATHMSDDVLAAYIFLHYNWAFDFLRPAMADIIQEYEATHGGDPPPLDNSDSEHESEDGENSASDAADDLEPQL